MNEVKFYRDDRGREPVAEFIKDLVDRTDKDGRINLKKILDYIKILKIKGKTAGEPFMKHIDGEIWELRPISYRILFAEWEDGDKRNLADIKRRILNE